MEGEKLCPRCNNVLPANAFHQGGRRVASYCKGCMSLYCRQHYVKNSALHNARRMASQRRYRLRNRAFIIDYLRHHPCVDCGEPDIVVLEFDHVEEKKYNMADLLRTGAGLGAIRREIERCVVRCANCHRRRTARQFGWGKGISFLPGCSSAW